MRKIAIYIENKTDAQGRVLASVVVNASIATGVDADGRTVWTRAGYVPCGSSIIDFVAETAAALVKNAVWLEWDTRPEPHENYPPAGGASAANSAPPTPPASAAPPNTPPGPASTDVGF